MGNKGGGERRKRKKRKTGRSSLTQQVKEKKGWGEKDTDQRGSKIGGVAGGSNMQASQDGSGKNRVTQKGSSVV